MLKMIEREILPYLKEMAGYFPVVTVLGPRQSGKTTLVKAAFPDYAYVNLEEPNAWTIAVSDPSEFFKRYPPPVIVDEIQRVPELLHTIQYLADSTDEKGRFILTGSHVHRLQEGVSQSLAGRTALVHLMPLSISELKKSGIEQDRDDYLFRGFMPRVYKENLPPQHLYANYYRTYVERDVKLLVNVANQRNFDLFVRLLAGRIGQLVNLHALSGEIGVSSTTLASWLNILEASFIVFRLPCFYNNYGKRLVKAQKIYFTDVGLASWLLGLTDAKQVAFHPQFGSLFENMVVLEALKARFNAGLESELYFFRDHHGLEVDLILNTALRLHALEIKASRTLDPSQKKSLEKFAKLSPDVISQTLVSAAEQEATFDAADFINFKNVGSRIRRLSEGNR